jgi:hypothetical protein
VRGQARRHPGLAAPCLREGRGPLRRADDPGQVLALQVVHQSMDGPGMVHQREHHAPRRRPERRSDHPIAVHDGREIRQGVVGGRIGLDRRADPEDQVVLRLARLQECAGPVEEASNVGRSFHPHRSRVAFGWAVSVRRPIAALDGGTLLDRARIRS